MEEIQARTKTYCDIIQKSQVLKSTGSFTLDKETGVSIVSKHEGKVRDVFVLSNNTVLLITTDRQSAFDRALGYVPFKGQVLTLTSAWWFAQTRHIVPNHFKSCINGVTMHCRKANVFPIEFVVRGYITGSTSTSMWTHYANNVRDFCGNTLDDGWVKHQKLPHNMVTPTTKDDTHDELISPEEIISSGRMTLEEWTYCRDKALELFEFGQQTALSRGMILVDTKYEFGKDVETGEIMVVDEVHTPDSSRYWIASSYDARMKAKQSPENIDKEFLRLWFKEHCDPYKDTVLPSAPAELITELSRRYLLLYEVITSEKFNIEEPNLSEDTLRNSIEAAKFK